MIVKRIRRGIRRARGTVRQMTDAVVALSTYVVDADPERLLQLTRLREIARYLLDGGHDCEGAVAMREELAEAGIDIGEKVETFGTRNLRSPDLAGWQMEMLATAARCPRSKNPFEHYVVGWREGDEPNDEQAEEAVDILVDTLGANDCQVLWSVHGNTPRRHIHVMMGRIDPANGTAVRIGDGWDIDRLHQAVALIEERQGWKHEANAPFVAKGGAVFDRATGDLVRDAAGVQMPRSKRAAPKAPDMDAKLKRRIGTAMTDATNWEDLHRRLTAIDVRYRAAGSGARILISGEEHKPSLLDRTWSRTVLQDRLGPFRPRDEDMRGSYEGYRQAATVELARIRTAYEQARSDLRASHDRTLAAIRTTPNAAVLRIGIRAEYAAAGRALDARFQETKCKFTESRLSLAKWTSGGRPLAPSAFPLPTLIFGESSAARERPAVGVVGLTARHHGWQTDYIDARGTVMFTDHRIVLLIHRVDLASVEAALILAARRWDKVKLSGSAAFMQLCAEIAAHRGIPVVDQNGGVLAPSRASKPVTPSKPQAPLAPISGRPPPRIPQLPLARPPAGTGKPIVPPSASQPAPVVDVYSVEELAFMKQQRDGWGR